MSQCNYCTLKDIKGEARARGLEVTVKSDDFGMGGVSVYVHGSDQELKSGESAAWFMELPEECVC